ncbi:MAG TPA: hypothetical protein VF080_18720 [Solirubrobacteraceae bacterium]
MSTPEVVSNGVTFEVERFEWVDGDRLEVTGRWYGLRGHRFVRPVLVVQAADSEQRRLLAVLDHKPWAAEDGDEWIAAFPWEGEPLALTAAELAVAPSLAVDLPVPRLPGQAGAAPEGSEGPLHARRGPAEATREPEPEPPAPARRGRSKAAQPADPPAPVEGITPEEVAALRAQLASEQASVRRLATQLEEAHQGLAAARAAADDHDALVAERDAAIAARDEARANANLDHDAIIEERDQAVSERAAALYARDEALDERAAANFERESALTERDAAFAERDRAVEAHRAAVRDLEALEQRVASAEQARLEAIASAPPAGAVRATPGEDRSTPQRSGIVWVQRVVALIVLIVWAIVVYKVLHGLV